jgi:uncharacterized protein YegL
MFRLLPVLLGLTTLVPGVAHAHLDVVFLLDTTGSMAREIREAKEKVREMAEALREAHDGQRIRLGVVAYRDRGDDYVTRISELTEDVDQTFKFLAALRADGGGDSPEDVIGGLTKALYEMNWDFADDVDRQVFLIGDAPPHLNYTDDLDPEQLIKDAVRQRIVINAIGCRSLSPGGIQFFRRMAYATEGSYQHIGRVRTPDDGLAQAMLEALTPAGDDARVERTPLGMRRSDSQALPDGPGHGVLVRHGQRRGDQCTLRIVLPAGTGLRGEPRAEEGSGDVLVHLELTQGSGGIHTYVLDRCVAPVTPIRVSFGG